MNRTQMMNITKQPGLNELRTDVKVHHPPLKRPFTKGWSSELAGVSRTAPPENTSDYKAAAFN